MADPRRFADLEFLKGARAPRTPTALQDDARRRAIDAQKFATVYPDGWFGRTSRAKRHATVDRWERDKFGNPARRDSKGELRRSSFSAEALCGAVGIVSGNEFKATEGDSITCSRCAKKVAAAKGHV